MSASGKETDDDSTRWSPAVSHVPRTVSHVTPHRGFDKPPTAKEVLRKVLKIQGSWPISWTVLGVDRGVNRTPEVPVLDLDEVGLLGSGRVTPTGPDGSRTEGGRWT